MNIFQSPSPAKSASQLQFIRVQLKDNPAATRKKRQILPRLSSSNSPDRGQLERFIHTVFHNAYGADVTHFMPQLLSLQDQDAQILAVCGLRQAVSEGLFLEAYLDQPIEAALSERIGTKVARSDIVEVGNMAVSERGLARALLSEVIQHLHATDAQWAVFTAIPALCNSLGRLNVQVEFLGEASIDKLVVADRQGWGSYYEQHPQVMAVRRLGACRTYDESAANPSGRSIFHRFFGQ